MLRKDFLSLASLFVLAAGGASASEFDVTINEIHYNPLSGEDRDEFIELHNRGPTSVSLAGWQFSEGVQLVFPANTAIEPKQFLVVCFDAANIAARHAITNVIGNYAGRLDNDGEIVTLVNAGGDVMSRVHYDDEGTWTSRPGGLGPALEIVDPHAVPDTARSWAASVIDGTPGRANSRLESSAGEASLLVSSQDLWRYLKGTQEASSPATAWTQTGFSDTSWTEAIGSFGYGGTGGFETELADMQGQGGYTTLYTRGRFTMAAPDIQGIQSGDLELSLAVRYDDAFVAYLNGTEVARENATNAGTPPPFDATADGSRNSQALVSLGGFAGLLIAGQNVLAIHGLNSQLASGDFFLEADLSLAERSDPTTGGSSPVTLNEVKPTEAGNPGFIEIHNSGATSFNLSNHAIIDSASHRFPIAGGTTVAAGGRRVFTEAQVGFSLADQEATYALVKAGPNGEDLVDALRLRVWPGNVTGLSFGRVPDGGDDLYLMTSPTQGAANTVALEANVILNEIHYHPPFVPPAGGCVQNCSDLRQWVELHNRGATAVNVAGWSLSKGVSLALPLTPAVNIPAGGYFVFVSSRSQFLAEHPGFDPARVAGDWQRDLAHDSDTINLNDALGNRVDHVKYGDGNPVNDLAPADGDDDRTFLGSEWTRGADGTGRSLELIHPRLDNRDGHAWAAGPMGGTPGAQNAAFNATPAAVIGDVAHSPAVPRPTEAVTVKCRVSAAQAITSVQAVWHREDAGGNGTATLRDDGLSGDGAAGDGVYGGTIPAQPDRAIVGFQVRAQLADSRVTTVPFAPAVPPYGGFTGPYYLYQVLATAPPVNPSENYYVVMAATDLNELTSRPLESDVLLPCTFLYLGKDGNESVRHLAGIRYRGQQTRDEDPKPYRIDFPSDRTFQDIEHLNLVSFQIDREILAADLFRRSGMPYPQEWTVNFTFQGALDPRYVRKEHVDEDFLARFYGNRSDGGNFYRALDPTGDPLAGDLSYFGEDPASYVPYYDKRNHQEENDYSDVIELCRAFDPVQTPDGLFADTIDGLIDANQWARYFALQTLLSNADGSIQTNSGEDFFLYRVPSTSGRPDAGKWVLVPWDIEESFANAGEQLFRAQLVTARRFLTHTQFAPLYYSNLVNLRNGAFNRFETRQRFSLMSFLFGFGTIDGLDTYITNRIGFVDTDVPVQLSAGASSTTTGTSLIAVGETWSYWKGSQTPSGAPLAWTQRAYVENGWLSGATGIGYGDGDDATELLDMQEIPGTQPGYATVYCRKKFNLASPATITNLDLIIDYDDGFVAYLNGTEVARRNAPGSVGVAVPNDALADQNREATGQPEPISLSSFLGSLVAGDNVLAIQALNGALDSSDLSMIPELQSGATVSGGIGCGNVLYSTTDSIGLSGRANGCFTRSVTVDGAPVTYDAFRARWSATVSLVPGENSIAVRAHDGPNGAGNLLETLLVTVTRLTRAPTSVAGTLNGTTTWTQAGGPYLMTGNVTIPAGSRLEIQPGTLIIGQAGASIIVRGLIQAMGTQQDPILFRALSCTNRWGGIALDGTGIAPASPTHLLRFCDLEFGDNPAGFIGCVSPVGSKLLVEDCSFRFLSANAIDATNARLEVRRSLFEKIAEGVHTTNTTSTIMDSTFKGMVGDKDAIDFDGDGTERSRIEGCRIDSGADDGIDLQASTVDIVDNVISNCADKAMSIEQSGSVGLTTLVRNIIYTSGSAFSLKSGVRINDAHHNTLVGNQEGVDLFAKAGASDGGHAVFHSLIVWNNIADVRLDALSTVSFTYSNVSSGVQPGAGNNSADPKFVSVAAANFALRPGSPCIGTGLAGTDMGAIPFDGSQPTFIRADSDGSGGVNITDSIFTLAYLFQSGPVPRCLDAADANDDAGVDISDPIFTLFFLFAGGRDPPSPFPAPGVDPTGDGVTCEG